MNPIDPAPAGGAHAIERSEVVMQRVIVRRAQLVQVAVAVLVGLAACLAGPPPAAAQGGTVYVESNNVERGANSIFALTYGPSGSMRPLRLTEFPTSGTGSPDVLSGPPLGILDADQQVVMNPERTLLFAVNQGSDTIAVFRIGGGGDLTPVPGSPFPSGGKAPASLGLRGDVLVVVNKSLDGQREEVADVAPVYTSFRVRADGGLDRIGNSTVPLAKGSNPTQALIAPSGNLIFDALFGGRKLNSFRLDDSGKLKQGPNTPRAFDPSVYAGAKAPPGLGPDVLQIPLGMAVHPKQKLFYVNAVAVPKLAVYSYREDGSIQFVNAVDNKGAGLPCWTIINRDGTRLYTSNTYTDTVSVYDITQPREPRQIQSVQLKRAGTPAELAFDPSQRFLFLLTPRNNAVVPPGEGNSLHTLQVGPDGRLKELATSPVPLPVFLGTSPQGIAVRGD